MQHAPARTCVDNVYIYYIYMYIFVYASLCIFPVNKSHFFLRTVSGWNISLTLMKRHSTAQLSIYAVQFNLQILFLQWQVQILPFLKTGSVFQCQQLFVCIREVSHNPCTKSGSQNDLSPFLWYARACTPLLPLQTMNHNQLDPMTLAAIDVDKIPP